MKKIYLLLFATLSLFAFSAEAQKMKFKKGELQFDGVAVAKITQNKESNQGALIRNTIIIKDLNDSILFTAAEHVKTLSGFVLPKSMLVLTGANGNTRELSTEDIRRLFTSSVELYMAHMIVNSGIDLITSKGVNLENVNEFFKSSKHDVSDEYDSLIARAKAKYVKEDELAASVGLSIDKSGNIFAKGEHIGKVSYIRPHSSSDPTSSLTHVYRITDINNIYIASISSFSILTSQFYNLETYDGKNFEIFCERVLSTSINTDEIAKRAVRRLYYENYIVDMLEKSGYIYNKKGYIIAGNEKKEGLIRLELVPKDVALGKVELNLTLSDYGSKAFLTPEDPNDKNTYKYDVKYNDGVILVTGSAKYYSIGGCFHKVLYERDGNMVLWGYIHNIPKLKLNGKGVTDLIYTTLGLNKRSDELKKDFNQYVNCPTLIYSDYNITGDHPSENVDRFIKLVNDYVEKCK